MSRGEHMWTIKMGLLEMAGLIVGCQLLMSVELCQVGRFGSLLCKWRSYCGSTKRFASSERLTQCQTKYAALCVAKQRGRAHDQLSLV